MDNEEDNQIPNYLGGCYAEEHHTKKDVEEEDDKDEGDGDDKPLNYLKMGNVKQLYKSGKGEEDDDDELLKYNEFIARNLYDKDLCDKYIQLGKTLTHPARIYIPGTTGISKTQAMVNILIDLLYFNTLTIFAYDVQQLPIKRLINGWINHNVENGNDKVDKKEYLHISDEIDRTPAGYNPELQNLVVFDDIIDFTKPRSSDCKNYKDFLTKGRGRNISSVTITQGYFQAPPMIRGQFTTLVLYNIAIPNMKSQAWKEWMPQVTKEVFFLILDFCFESRALASRSSDMYACFVVTNRSEPDIGLKYRKGFEPYSIFNREGKLIIGNRHKPQTVYKAHALPLDTSAFGKKEFKEDKKDKKVKNEYNDDEIKNLLSKNTLGGDDGDGGGESDDGESESESDYDDDVVGGYGYNDKLKFNGDIDDILLNSIDF